MNFSTVCSGVKFESEILLNSHIASIHTSKIKCEICDLTYISKEELWEHLDKDHEWKQLHECNVCGAEFNNKVLLNSHIESEHECKDGRRSENLGGRAEIDQFSLPNLPKPVPLILPAALKRIPTIATKESSTERYSENI